MPLQNRVDPFGELFADSARGRFFGNRGGRFHTDDRTLTRRRWVSRTWICCVLEFKNRHRDVWGRSYTELFFLDEVTALAAGHRPCFECRRRDALAFAEFWRQSCKLDTRPRAGEMDDVLHQAPAQTRDRRSARRRVRRDGGGRVRGTRRLASAMDALRLRRAQAPAARRHCRRTHPASDPCRACCGLPAAMASKRTF
jgi:hypothetical protein